MQNLLHRQLGCIGREGGNAECGDSGTQKQGADGTDHAAGMFVQNRHGRLGQCMEVVKHVTKNPTVRLPSWADWLCVQRSDNPDL